MKRSRFSIWAGAALICFAGRTSAQLVPAKSAELAARLPAEERLRIDQAVPRTAPVSPLKKRRLLIFDLNVNYGGHRSIAYANYAFTLMGELTGAYETVISQDPAVFRRESLSQIGAVFFNNNVGNLFTSPELRQSLLDFVYAGGGVLGVHGTAVAFMQWPGAIEDWPEFGLLLGARGANHRDSDERVVIKLDDPSHPLNRAFDPAGFEFRDEFFRVHGPYSRSRVRVILSIDNARTDMNQGAPRGDCLRADNDYALSWVRNYGRGRTFYCSIAHNPWVFWDARMLRFYLSAIQFALGDLPAPTTPSARLTPAIRAQEKLGWRVGLSSNGARPSTLFALIDQAAETGFSYVCGSSAQSLSLDCPKPFDHHLSELELQQLRLKLDAAGVRLLAYSVPTLPDEESQRRSLFSFARRLGAEALIAGSATGALALLADLTDEFGIDLALRRLPRNEGLPASRTAHGGHVEFASRWAGKLARGPSPLGVVEIVDPGRLAAEPVGSVSGTRSSGFSAELARLHDRQEPAPMFFIDTVGENPRTKLELTQCARFFDTVATNLAPRAAGARPE